MSALDYYNEILVDHNNVQDLHKQFIAAYKNKEEDLMNNIANTIVHKAALHSDGEELSIYKVLDAHGLHKAAEKDCEEHQQVKQAMLHVDSNSVSLLGINEFANAVKKACQLFIQHAEASLNLSVIFWSLNTIFTQNEENNQYKQLSAKLSTEEKASLAKDFLKAREMAPSRPHPSAPQHGGVGQKIMGTLAKPANAAITASRHLVDLKYQHASATYH